MLRDLPMADGGAVLVQSAIENWSKQNSNEIEKYSNELINGWFDYTN